MSPWHRTRVVRSVFPCAFTWYRAVIPIYTHQRLSGRINADGSYQSPNRIPVHTFGPVADEDQAEPSVRWYASLRGGSVPSVWVEMPPGAELVEDDRVRPGNLVVVWQGRIMTAAQVRSFAFMDLHGFRRVEPATIAEAAAPVGS